MQQKLGKQKYVTDAKQIMRVLTGNAKYHAPYHARNLADISTNDKVNVINLS